MNMKHTPQQGDILIIRSGSILMKAKILEATETTYCIANLDDLGANYIINADAVTQKTVEKIVNEFKNCKYQLLIKDETEYNVKFRIEKESFEKEYTVLEVIDSAELKSKRQLDLIEELAKTK